MSYIIQEFPQDKYRFRLYDNVKRLTWQQIQAETGCTAILNLAYFHLTTYAHQAALMIAGKWVHEVNWHEYGICIDQGGALTVGTELEAVYDYAIGCPPVVINGVDKGKGEGGRNGWTYTGVKPDGTVVALLCSKDTPEYTATLEAALRARGCTSIIRWDGSWSSQGTLGPGKSVTPSQRRICRSWLLIYERAGAETPEDKEENMSKYTVCLDPGHGPGTVNGSPDGSYKEHEFAWDMYGRISKLLEARGVHTICTRTEDTKPSLTERAGVANRAGATCFVSLHSNAAGPGGWYDADGLEIYTSAGPETAERNVLAGHLLEAFGAAGVALRANAAKHEMYTVLAETDMPAVLIEYGFHTSKTDVPLLLSGGYRDKLAAATADGVCKWLGVSWADGDEPPAGETDRTIVQRRFGFADETMDYLCKYQYADALLERLATAD
ncbi:hypothetical protein B5E80_18910 [Flavonifractor sp. An135]|nr:N-acetylmuramoyl-L-alanine amidase [Flavonifractor sp. An135]OUQ16682.1 hypothetical protein B5E80_18910 [Flavonifractor sp. An135]